MRSTHTTHTLMATGRKNVFSGGSVKGSEMVYDFTCTPCSKDGQYVEAINYCSQCAEYFCPTCTKQHMKFGSTSDHKVVNTTVTRRSGGVPPSPVVRETCREHHWERLTTYCADHDLVVCNTCVSVDHRLCDGISYIPKVAGGAKQSKEINKIKKQMSESLQSVSQSKQSLQRGLRLVDVEKIEYLTRIHGYTERLIKHARALEKAAVSEVNNHHKIATDKLHSGAMSLDEAMTAMRDRINSLDNARGNSDAQVFVDIKRGKEEVANARQLEKESEFTASGKSMPEFVVREDADYFLFEVRTLGQFIYKAYTAAPCGEFQVAIREEKQTCLITDTCELADGSILLADYDNASIKKLDKAYKVKECIGMASSPYGICRTGPDEVAVTLTQQKKVQFVNVRGQLRPSKSFSVADCCRGLCYNQGELFVACGGHPGGGDLDPEGAGCVAVYDTSGYHLRTIHIDDKGAQLFSVPRHITATHQGNKIHITDTKSGVITTDKQGKVLSKFSAGTLAWTGGLCAVAGDNILVCGYDSHNVVQISSEGKMVAELLGGKNGVKNPRSVQFLRGCSRLVLTENGSNMIKVFSLKM